MLGWASQKSEGGGEVVGESRAKAKVLLLGGGGYHSPNAARAWACMTAMALERMQVPPQGDQDGQSQTSKQEDGGDDADLLTLSTPIPLSLASWPLFTADRGNDCLDVPAALRHDAQAAQVGGREGEEEEEEGEREDEDERYLREIETMFARRVEELRVARG